MTVPATHPERRSVPGAPVLDVLERVFISGLHRQALQYFLDNQAPGGLIFDRQANHGPLRHSDWSSTSATGMGLIALALAAAPPYRLLSPAEALHRVRAAVDAALDRVPNDRGILPHFLDADSDAARGHDVFSTIDASWLVAGALWAAAFLRDAELERRAEQLYDRVDWLYWTDPAVDGRGLLRHGKLANGQFIPTFWDRVNGETAFMYVLGAGAAEERALPPKCWSSLRPFYGRVAGLRFNNADLGLFTFEYGLDLLDLRRCRPPGPVDLAAEARVATRANYLFCQREATYFRTYRRFWGVSNGDGPGDAPQSDTYRARSPHKPIDGTAQIIDTLAAIANAPAEVLDNLHEADSDTKLGLRGRYGFSPVNLDHNWVGRDIVGIDAGAAVLALDNYLQANRVRRVFHSLPCIRRGIERLGFRVVEKLEPAPSVLDEA